MQAIDLFAIPAGIGALQFRNELFSARFRPQQSDVADRTAGQTFQYRKIGEEIVAHHQDQRIVFDQLQRLFCGQEGVR